MEAKRDRNGPVEEGKNEPISTGWKSSKPYVVPHDMSMPLPE